MAPKPPSQKYHLDLSGVKSPQDLVSRVPKLFTDADEMFQVLFRAIKNITTGTLGAGIQSVINDTNITAVISGTTLILGWLGLLAVGRGGTGVGTFTPYAPIAGGTTSSGPLQSIASVGTAGQVLTSNGPGALSTFQTGVQGIQTLSVPITDAQFKAIPTTPFQIIATPGAGKRVELLNASLYMDATAGAYAQPFPFAGFRQMLLKYDTTGDFATSALYDDTSVSPGDGAAITGNGLQGFNTFITNAAVRILRFGVGGYADSFNESDGLIYYDIGDVRNNSISLYMDNTGGNLTGGNSANTIIFTVTFVTI